MKKRPFLRKHSSDMKPWQIFAKILVFHQVCVAAFRDNFCYKGNVCTTVAEIFAKSLFSKHAEFRIFAIMEKAFLLKP